MSKSMQSDTVRGERYAIVTPAKNEVVNVPRLVSAIARQSHLPFAWIFMNDGSTDDTESVFKSEIARNPALRSACRITVLSLPHTQDAYGLGVKYARVVKTGLDAVLSNSCFDSVEFIGVLDCDVFPQPHYYARLLNEFASSAKLGIVSGGTQYEEIEGRRDVEKSVTNRSHAPGGLRLWRRECLNQTGYQLTVSQDAVSEARAIMLGWRVRSFSDISVTMRKRGAKFGYVYYGRSAYVRCLPVWYVLLGAIRLFVKGRGADAAAYLRGYRMARRSNEPIIQDELALKYFKRLPFYRLIGR